MPSPSSLKIVIENEQGFVRCIQGCEDDTEIIDQSQNIAKDSSHTYETKCVEKDDALSLLFSRLGLKNKSSSPIAQCSPTPSFQAVSPDCSNHLQVNSSFPLLLAPSNKSRKSRMVFFSSPSEECESTVREILSTLSERFHTNLESKSSSCISKQKKMKSSTSSSHRFCTSFDSC